MTQKTKNNNKKNKSNITDEELVVIGMCGG